VAGRNQTWQWLASRLFRGPTLEQAWAYSSGAAIVKLDLKQSDRWFLDEVVAFLGDRSGRPAAMVTSPDAAAVEYLHEHLPAGVQLAFSANGPDALHRLQADAVLRDCIDAVSIFHQLVNPDVVDWAHRNRLRVLAWTVNDGPRLADLIRDGVDGVTTANLAIVRALDSPTERTSG